MPGEPPDLALEGTSRPRAGAQLQTLNKGGARRGKIDENRGGAADSSTPPLALTEVALCAVACDGWRAGHRKLLTDAQLGDDGTIALDVLLGQVVQHLAALT